jgi:hypothetical protein
MSERPNSPDEQTLRRHLEAGRFRSAVAAGWWRLVSIEWPHTVIAVTARDGAEYAFRFECSNYPRTAATAQPWDVERNAPLAHGRWPTGRSRVPMAFNPAWKGGTCLYLPCDRLSIDGHQNWVTQHPALLWDSEKGICKYLGIIHELLNSSDYGGRHAA